MKNAKHAKCPAKRNSLLTNNRHAYSYRKLMHAYIRRIYYVISWFYASVHHTWCKQ